MADDEDELTSEEEQLGLLRAIVIVLEYANECVDAWKAHPQSLATMSTMSAVTEILSRLGSEAFLADDHDTLMPLKEEEEDDDAI
jgi:hypothetical protein